MKKDAYVNTLIIFSVIGVLFSGYLTLGGLITGACPISGECPYFLGYPACDYGLIMFLILFVSSLFVKKTKTALQTAYYVSLLGILFAGYFSIVELLRCLKGCSFKLLLPTCVYGLIMYIVIFAISVILSKNRKSR